MRAAVCGSTRRRIPWLADLGYVERTMRASGALLLVAVLDSGCTAATARGLVVQQASFDHDCPRQSVAIVEENSSIWAYRLMVCGKERKYRDRGGDKTFQFVDVTDNPAAIPAAAKSE
jgi:hypothetical protein